MLVTIVDIYSNIDLPRGVLNVMIVKTLNDKGGDLPSVKYIEKMSTTWIQDGVLSTLDAIKYSTSLKDEVSKEPVKSGLRKEGFDEL